MLENYLYYIENKEIEEDSAIFYIALKANCEIFKGHFPGLPITPGVCLVEMASELFATVIGKNCEIIKCKNIKFLNVVSPVDHPNITYKINWNALENNIFNLKVDIFQGEDTFSKMNIEVRTK